jgi:hypothetical protein
MRIHCVVVALLAVAVVGGAMHAQVPASRVVFSFDEEPVNQAPEAFILAASRQSSPGPWEVRGAAMRRHLLHAADPSVTDRGIALAVASMAQYADVHISSRLRVIDADRAGGVVWRYRDANNFYFAGIALSEGTTVLVRVAGGNRILLDIIRDVQLDPEMWHTISVTHHGDQIRGMINGLTVLQARDRTLDQPGRAGVWSAGNSTTWFDDIAIEPAKE